MPIYEWDFAFVLNYRDVLWEGFLGTLKIGFSSLGLGIVIGLGLALMRLSRFWFVKVPAIAIIEFFRATPVLVLLFWCYYALPIVIGVAFDPYTAAVITLGFQTGAFMAEVYRAGIVSIDRSQWEGGKALGMNLPQLMARIILPQAVRRMVPPFLERSFELMKTTTQASVITYGELLYKALVLSAQLYRPLEIFTLVAAFYFVMLTIASFSIRYVETRLDAART